MISWVSMSRLSTETISLSLAANSTLWGLARNIFGPTPLGIPSISELSFSVRPPTETYPSNKNWVEASARSYNWDPPNVELLQSQGAKASPINKDVGGTGNSVICRHDQGVPEPRSTQRQSITIIHVEKSWYNILIRHPLCSRNLFLNILTTSKYLKFIKVLHGHHVKANKAGKSVQAASTAGIPLHVLHSMLSSRLDPLHKYPKLPMP